MSSPRVCDWPGSSLREGGIEGRVRGATGLYSTSPGVHLNQQPHVCSDV